MNKLYKNKKWLWKQYWILKKSTIKIANEQQRNNITIGRYLVKFGIKKRTRKESAKLRWDNIIAVYKNKKWLYNQYVLLKKSSRQIAEEHMLRPRILDYWLKKYGIEMRDNSLSSHLIFGNHTNLSKKAREFLDGILLGDGNVSSVSKWSGCIACSCKYRGYLKWLSKKLSGFGIQQSGKIYMSVSHAFKKRKKYKNRIYAGYTYKSLSYAELKGIRDRWYKNGIKIIPRGIRLTPTICLYWYIGDGCLGKHKQKVVGISFATCCFSIKEIKLLVKKMNILGFETSIQPAHKLIGLPRRSVDNFLKYIGSCPKEINNFYGYKWLTKGGRK